MFCYMTRKYYSFRDTTRKYCQYWILPLSHVKVLVDSEPFEKKCAQQYEPWSLVSTRWSGNSIHNTPPLSYLILFIVQWMVKIRSVILLIISYVLFQPLLPPSLQKNISNFGVNRSKITKNYSELWENLLKIGKKLLNVFKIWVKIWP